MGIKQSSVKVEKDRGSSVHSKAFYKKGSVARFCFRVLIAGKHLISLPILSHMIHCRENHEGHQWSFDLQTRFIRLITFLSFIKERTSNS